MTRKVNQYKLHTPPGSFHAFKVLIAAEYNHINIIVPDSFDAELILAKSPTGKGPLLEVSSNSEFSHFISESNVIARYIAKLDRASSIMGENITEESKISAWMDWCKNELELPACIWWYPVVGYTKFQSSAYEMAKIDFSRALKTLNGHLDQRKYIVGTKMTLADISIVSALVYPMKLVCDETYLESFPNVVRWFLNCIQEESFKTVIGDISISTKESTTS